MAATADEAAVSQRQGPALPPVSLQNPGAQPGPASSTPLVSTPHGRHEDTARLLPWFDLAAGNEALDSRSLTPPLPTQREGEGKGQKENSWVEIKTV